MRFPKLLWPQSLRIRILLTTLVLVSLPILGTGYLLEGKAREMIIAEKQEKLFGVTRLLDAHLPGGFSALLADYRGAPGDRAEQIHFLNARLREYTDTVAAAYPGVGVGYYHKGLNAIITYGPSAESGDKVGMTLPSGHPGWKVLALGTRAVETGLQVRGRIMNAMWPMAHDGQVVGYTWANEFSNDVERQVREMDVAMYTVIGFSLVLGLVPILYFNGRLTWDIESIKDGLHRLRYDLRQPLAPLRGELGEIAAAINDMAKSVLDARSLNENILASTADGVITVDVEGNVTSINPAAQEMSGRLAAEVIGRPYTQMFRAGAEATSYLLDTLRGGGEHVGVPFDFALRDRTLHVTVSTSLLRDGDGHAIGAVAVFKDLTEQRRLQMQVLRADRLAALGELMAGVAHEIRNPLTSIRGFIQYLSGGAGPEEVAQYAPVVTREVDRLNRIISELLEFAKPYPARIAPVGLNALIREITVLVKSRCASQGVALDLILDPELPTVEADEEQLKQVLLNLVINALQATPGTGRICLSTSRDGPGWVKINVADTGEGIAPADVEKVFDPFFSTKPAGTGLGLAVVQRIVSGHGGKIGIGSDRGRGTVIHVCLPEVHGKGVTA